MGWWTCSRFSNVWDYMYRLAHLINNAEKVVLGNVLHLNDCEGLKL